MHHRSLSILGAPLAGALILMSVSCETPASPTPELMEAEVQPTFNRSVQSEVAQDDLLKAARQATARFHSPTQALRAGYEPADHCVEIPGVGGMGYHWANESLVHDSFDPLEPQVLLYATGPSGRPELVGVEYVVIDVGQEHPTFGDHPFDVGGTPIPVDHWSLHVWLYEENPEGIFEQFNPNVSCP